MHIVLHALNTSDILRSFKTQPFYIGLKVIGKCMIDNMKFVGIISIMTKSVLNFCAFHLGTSESIARKLIG